MRDIEIEAVHQKLPDTKRSSVASNPSIRAAPRNSGTRNTRILAIEVSNKANSTPPTASLATYATMPSAQRRQSRAARFNPPWREQTGNQRHVENELEPACQLYQRQMAAGIFEHHGLVDHGQLEMGRRIVDRDAAVFGDRNHDQ